MLFLTHARQDVELALRLSAELETRRQSTWISGDGDRFALADPSSRVAQAVSRAAVCVVLISFSNAGAPELVETVRALRGLGVRAHGFFAVLIGGLDESALPHELEGAQMFELRGIEDAKVAELAVVLLDASRGRLPGAATAPAPPVPSPSAGAPEPSVPPPPAAESAPPVASARRGGFGSWISAAGEAVRSVFRRATMRSLTDVGEAAGAPRPDDDGTKCDLKLETAPKASIEPEGALPSDPVRFSVFAPVRIAAGESFVLDVWAYLSAQRIDVLQRGSKRGTKAEVGEQGPVALPRGIELEVMVAIDGQTMSPQARTLLWIGEPANATFELHAPQERGRHLGYVLVAYGGVRVTRLAFELEVAASSGGNAELAAREERVRNVFASYASEDRAEALRIRRALEPLDIDVFVDVLDLRQGQDWEQRLWNEIPACDRFYLLWSSNAARSPWVEREWRCALQKRGLDFIEPVSLVDPREAPPPEELSALHFNSSARIALEYEEHRKG